MSSVTCFICGKSVDASRVTQHVELERKCMLLFRQVYDTAEHIVERGLQEMWIAYSFDEYVFGFDFGKNFRNEIWGAYCKVRNAEAKHQFDRLMDGFFCVDNFYYNSKQYACSVFRRAIYRIESDELNIAILSSNEIRFSPVVLLQPGYVHPDIWRILREKGKRFLDDVEKRIFQTRQWKMFKKACANSAAGKMKRAQPGQYNHSRLKIAQWIDS